MSLQGLLRAATLVQPRRSLLDFAFHPLRHQHGPRDRAGVPSGVRQSWWCRSGGGQAVHSLDKGILMIPSSNIIKLQILSVFITSHFPKMTRFFVNLNLLECTHFLLIVDAKQLQKFWTNVQSQNKCIIVSS